MAPGLAEDCENEVDDDCDGYADALDSECWPDVGALNSDDDGDGFSENIGDCDDGRITVHPGADEVAGDGVDSDCDGIELCFVDADQDGFTDGTTTIGSLDVDCSDPGEATAEAPTGDCADADPTRNPGVRERPGDHVDSDCDGSELCYADADDDGYPDFSQTVVSADADCLDAGEGRATDAAGECDDTDPDAHPGAPEVAGDGVDQDCDGVDPDRTDDDTDKGGCSTSGAAPPPWTWLGAAGLLLVSARRRRTARS